MKKARLQELYQQNIRPELQKTLGLDNVMKVPRITKIVLNAGVGKEAVADSKVVSQVAEVLTRIAGQKAVRTLARKSIAGFKLREGMPLGAMVTLRGKRMYDFLDKFINLALPGIRDFQGVGIRFDRRGNYNLGIREWVIFPEVEYDVAQKAHGLNVTICTSSATDEHAFELLKSFGMPFRKQP